jgi:hypothetical protein
MARPAVPWATPNDSPRNTPCRPSCHCYPPSQRATGVPGLRSRSYFGGVGSTRGAPHPQAGLIPSIVPWNRVGALGHPLCCPARDHPDGKGCWRFLRMTGSTICPQLRHRSPQNHSQLLGDSGKTSATSNPPQRAHGRVSLPVLRSCWLGTAGRDPFFVVRLFGFLGMRRLIGFDPSRQG